MYGHYCVILREREREKWGVRNINTACIWQIITVYFIALYFLMFGYLQTVYYLTRHDYLMINNTNIPEYS